MEFIKEPKEFTKEFIKASRQIYKLISMNPKVSTAQMADSMGLSTRQVLKYLKRLQELGKIARVGGRKWENGKLSMKNTRDSLIEYKGEHPCMGVNLICQ